MIDWSRGYSCEYSLVGIDPRTWTKTTSVNRIASANVNRDGTDDVPLLETATLTIDGDIEDGWYRILAKASQDGISENQALGTFLMNSSSSTYYGTARKTSSVNGYSVLKPCSTMKCHIGEYAPKGGSVGAWVAGMLSKCTPAPVRLGSEARVALSDYFVFDSGTKVIQAVWNVLDDSEWCLQIDGDGTIWVLPKPDTPKMTMDRGAYGILQPQFDRSVDKSDAPNVYRVVHDDKEIEIVNSDPSSVISTVSRGYRVEEFDSNPSLLEGESYENYGKRKLKELSAGMDEWSFKREYIPDMRVFDIWDCRRSDVGMVGNARVLSQKLTLDKGITVDEKVGIEVDDYAVEYVDLSDR